LKPRHLAAAQYTVLAIFFWASWKLLLSPLERAIGQFEFIFAPSYENRTFFIFYAVAAIISTILSVIFWFQKASLMPLSTWLAVTSAIFFVIALWLFDTSLILGFGLGCVFALWSRFAPNHSFKRDVLKRAPYTKR